MVEHKWRYIILNSFMTEAVINAPNAPFLYPLKTSENRNVFWCFQGVKKGYICNEKINVNYLIGFI